MLGKLDEELDRMSTIAGQIRRPDPPGEPLPTSYREDLYQQVFGAADAGARV